MKIRVEIEMAEKTNGGLWTEEMHWSGSHWGLLGLLTITERTFMKHSPRLTSDLMLDQFSVVWLHRGHVGCWPVQVLAPVPLSLSLSLCCQWLCWPLHCWLTRKISDTRNCFLRPGGTLGDTALHSWAALLCWQEIGEKHKCVFFQHTCPLSRLRTIKLKILHLFPLFFPID